MSSVVDTNGGGDFDEAPIDEEAEQKHAETHVEGVSRYRIVNFFRGSCASFSGSSGPTAVM